MRFARAREVGAPILLTLVGALAATASLPRLAFSSTLPACVTESSGTAWLGLHLRLLAATPACPEGTFARGEHYDEIAQFSVFLSVSTLVAGLIALGLALGLGIWARQALRSARAWIRRHVSVLRPLATVRVWRRPELPTMVVDRHQTLLARLFLLRGPPVPVLA